MTLEVSRSTMPLMIGSDLPKSRAVCSTPGSTQDGQVHTRWDRPVAAAAQDAPFSLMLAVALDHACKSHRRAQAARADSSTSCQGLYSPSRASRRSSAGCQRCRCGPAAWLTWAAMGPAAVCSCVQAALAPSCRASSHS